MVLVVPDGCHPGSVLSIFEYPAELGEGQKTAAMWRLICRPTPAEACDAGVRPVRLGGRQWRSRAGWWRRLRIQMTATMTSSRA